MEFVTWVREWTSNIIEVREDNENERSESSFEEGLNEDEYERELKDL